MFSTNGDRIERDATLHPPLSPAIGERMDAVRASVKGLAHLIDELVPDGREKSMALTSLIDEALPHAIAGIARNQHLIPLNQK